MSSDKTFSIPERPLTVQEATERRTKLLKEAAVQDAQFQMKYGLSIKSSSPPPGTSNISRPSSPGLRVK